MSGLNARKLFGLTVNTTNAGFVASTTSTYSTTATTACVIGGKWATTLAVQTTTATPTTDAATGVAFVAMGVNKACAFVFGTNAAGAIKVVQGPIVDTDVGVTTTVGAFREAPQFGNMPDDFCPCAYTLVRTAPSASAWTFGSSNWGATGITALTFVNVAILPDRPQTA